MRAGIQTFYVACTYTKYSLYDEEGAPVVVKIVTDSIGILFFGIENAWCTYNCKGEDGNVYDWKSGRITFDKKIKNISTLFDEVFKR